MRIKASMVVSRVCRDCMLCFCWFNDKSRFMITLLVRRGNQFHGESTRCWWFCYTTTSKYFFFDLIIAPVSLEPPQSHSTWSTASYRDYMEIYGLTFDFDIERNSPSHLSVCGVDHGSCGALLKSKILVTRCHFIFNSDKKKEGGKKFH